MGAFSPPPTSYISEDVFYRRMLNLDASLFPENTNVSFAEVEAMISSHLSGSLEIAETQIR